MVRSSSSSSRRASSSSSPSLGVGGGNLIFVENLLHVCVLVALLLLISSSALIMQVNAETKDAQESIEQVSVEEEAPASGVEEIGGGLFAPKCDPDCDAKHFCNFLGKCEPYPILIMECSAGGSCDKCHCSGECVNGVCQQH